MGSFLKLSWFWWLESSKVINDRLLSLWVSSLFWQSYFVDIRRSRIIKCDWRYQIKLLSQFLIFFCYRIRWKPLKKQNRVPRKREQRGRQNDNNCTIVTWWLEILNLHIAKALHEMHQQSFEHTVVAAQFVICDYTILIRIWVYWLWSNSKI